MKSTKAATKEVTVLNVYKFNHISRVCFQVESSDGSTTYNTCFNGDVNHATCGCDGFEKWHKVCYHITQLTPRAQTYFDSLKAAETEETPGMDAAETHIASLKAAQVVSVPAPQKEAWTDAEERRYNAPLNNNNKPFSLVG